MLDIKYIRDNKEKVEKATKGKNMDPKIVDMALELDEKRKGLLQEVEALRAERNVAAKEQDKEKGKEVKTKLQDIEPKLRKLERKYKTTLWRIPNVVADDVVFGKDESENKVVRKWGEPTKFDFKPKDHLELGESLGMIDVKKASKISGARFNYLFGDGALLQFALVQYAFSVLTDEKILKSISKKYSSKPFIPVIPPVMIKPEIFGKMGRRYPEEERYFIKSDNVFLIGSAEHTLGPLHMDESIPQKNFPIRYVGYSPAFRREAGTYGKDTKGILRVHQFDKIEIESFTTPENSDKEQEFIIAIQEYLMKELEIPYQVVSICTGDMGGPDYRQVDIEAWLPGQSKYRETHTSDNMTDYQSRRLGTKVNMGKETTFAHMNDATVFAIGRTIIAIMENYQQKDGSIKIPEALQKWMGKKEIKI